MNVEVGLYFAGCVVERTLNCTAPWLRQDIIPEAVRERIKCEKASKHVMQARRDVIIRNVSNLS
jgi:hypothetical protein